MTLVAEKKVSLEEPANKYLVESKLHGPNGNPDSATVRRLGAHVGGLPSMFERYFSGERTQMPEPETLLSEYGRLAYPAGSYFEYSNIGYAALGAIASNITGMEFGVLMTRTILEPLALRDSFFGTNATRLQISAVHYDGSDNPIPYYTTSTPASGELYASAHDLLRFAMFNLKNRLKDQSWILDERWIDELHKPVFAGPSGTATTFGWFSGRTKSGVPVIFKGGRRPGVATIMYMVPPENLACLVLTNRSDNREFALSLCGQIVAGFLPDWTPPTEDIGPPSGPFVATPNFAGQWEGTLMGGGANMRVALVIPSSGTAALSLGGMPWEKVTDMQSEGIAFTAKSAGVIESADAIRNEATTLALKLIAENGKLVGRILATARKPGTLLPYVLTLNRKSEKAPN
jgi:CubicO group peptidase (beta-lactamase class C family)